MSTTETFGMSFDSNFLEENQLRLNGEIWLSQRTKAPFEDLPKNLLRKSKVQSSLALGKR
jgi:hypothetical protein